MNYRRDIDGLRAIAILPVIFFHAGFNSFDHGYLGVDIFFVISGFLITSFILNDLKKEKFNVLNFFDRRARRIMPGLVFIMLASIPLAILYMQPDDLENFGQSLFATSLFSNNFLLYLTSGYWDIGSEFKPLLHTWSLSVEEQYYLIFPFLMLLIWKLNSFKWMVSIFVFIAISSFFYYYFGSFDNESIESIESRASFLLLFGRAWQILLGAIGALIAYETIYKTGSLKKFYREFICMLGLFLIFLSMFSFLMFDINQIYLPVLASLGSFLLLIFSSQNLISTAVLRSRLFVWIGLISYSLYLWHQPLFAFARIRSFDEPSFISMILLMIFLVPLAVLSFKLEKFFKSSEHVNHKIFYSSLVVSLLIICSVGLTFHFSNGFYKNYQELTAPYLVEDKFYDNDGYIVDAFKYQDIEFSGNKRNLIITGDSFARDFINMGRSNDYFKNYEFTIRSFNCFNNQNYTDDEKYNLFKEGNLIIISYRILPSEASKKCLINKISYLEKNKIDFLVIGTKDFGFNINRPLKDKIYTFKATPSREILDFNDFLKENVPQEKFIDLLDLISSDGRVPLFTEDNKLMSIDRAHLTYFGAREVGKIIFSDIRLNDLK
ncbi:acyltransferase [Gammaproteobacteria bacterium]|jgi:peptidoglycan/LPS O-acetylase OafA/YrhL|nr:acyltransferase [Gammaproteobacteria bacterium]